MCRVITHLLHDVGYVSTRLFPLQTGSQQLITATSLVRFIVGKMQESWEANPKQSVTFGNILESSSQDLKQVASPRYLSDLWPDFQRCSVTASPTEMRCSAALKTSQRVLSCP